MAKLSELLDYLLTQKGISKYMLAKKIGVDNSSFYKMLSGQRKISYDIFRQILISVPLTYEEKKELKICYKMMTLGEEKYCRRQAIMEFIQALNNEHEEIQLCHRSDIFEILQETIYGKNNLSRIIYSVILSEAEQGGCLKIICQTDFPVLYDTLNLLDSQKSLEIQHILCLENHSKNHEAENIQVLTTIAPLFRNYFFYRPYYFYGNTASYCGNMAAFPFFLLGQKTGVMFSSDYESGVVFTEPKILSILSERFETIKNRASSLLMFFEDVEDASRSIKKQKLFPEKEIYILSPNVFWANNCDMEFWINLLKDDIPNREKLVELMKNEGEKAKKQSIQNKVCSYFTREGVKDFWETGYVIDVLADYYKPVPKQDRKILLQKTLEDIEKDCLFGRLFRKDVIRLSRDFYLMMQNENAVNCIFRKKNGSFAGLNFQENMLCEGMGDFLLNLEEEELLETKETTVQFLREVIAL